MKEYNLKYQVSLFGSFDDIDLSVNNLKFLIDLFEPLNLIPSSVQEIEIAPGSTDIMIEAGKPTGFNFDSSDKVNSVQFRSRRLNFLKQSIDLEHSDLGTLDDFLKFVLDSIGQITEHFHKKFNRLSLVSGTYFNDLDDEQLGSAYSHLVSVLPFHKTNAPVEWHIRNVSRVPFAVEQPEITNVITQAKMVRGSQATKAGKLTEVSGISLETDINTFQGNIEFRFEVDSLGKFLSQAHDLRNELIEEFKRNAFRA